MAGPWLRGSCARWIVTLRPSIAVLLAAVPLAACGDGDGADAGVRLTKDDCLEITDGRLADPEGVIDRVPLSEESDRETLGSIRCEEVVVLARERRSDDSGWYRVKSRTSNLEGWSRLWRPSASVRADLEDLPVTRATGPPGPRPPGRPDLEVHMGQSLSEEAGDPCESPGAETPLGEPVTITVEPVHEVILANVGDGVAPPVVEVRIGEQRETLTLDRELFPGEEVVAGVYGSDEAVVADPGDEIRESDEDNNSTRYVEDPSEFVCGPR